MTHFPLASSEWGAEEYAAIQRVVGSGCFTMGREVDAFERQFAAYMGGRFAVMVNSGSSANLVGLAAALYHPDIDLAPNDEVIVPAVSWSTTFFPVHQLGLSLCFVDIDRDTLNLDCDQVEAAISPRTRAIFAVNLLGNPCDLGRLRAIARRHRLILIEDNCEAPGARFEGHATGTLGLFGTFSTYFSHHINTMEGGVVVTDDEKLYHAMLSLRAHGWLREQPSNSHLNCEVDPFTRLFRFVLPGYNVRPLELAGAIGQSQLRKLPDFLSHRRANAATFRALLGDIPYLRLQRETGESAWFGLSVVLEGPLASRRYELAAALQLAGVECRPVVAGNFLANPVIRHLNHRVAGKLAVAEEIDSSGLMIGNHSHPIDGPLARVAAAMRRFVH